MWSQPPLDIAINFVLQPLQVLKFQELPYQNPAEADDPS